ncbi:MAG: hypothetical protein MPJ08_01105 [Nitrosopumilus sp.]|nr:hypothetical protein [Nitrosopumilus sp.]
MRRHHLHPNLRSPPSKTDCGLDDVLVKIIFRTRNMLQLYILARDYKDNRLNQIYSYYGMLESYEFILAVQKLLKLSDGDEKTKINAMRPLISYLLNYKDGLRNWRTNRIAHLYDLDVSSITYYAKYKIPITVKDFNTIFRIMFFLHEYITDVYREKVSEISKKSQSNQQNQAIKILKLKRNHDISGFKDQAAENLYNISGLFKHSEYLTYSRLLRQI